MSGEAGIYEVTNYTLLKDVNLTCEASKTKVNEDVSRLSHKSQ